MAAFYPSTNPLRGIGAVGEAVFVCVTASESLHQNGHWTRRLIRRFGFYNSYSRNPIRCLSTASDAQAQLDILVNHDGIATSDKWIVRPYRLWPLVRKSLGTARRGSRSKPSRRVPSRLPGPTKGNHVYMEPQLCERELTGSWTHGLAPPVTAAGARSWTLNDRAAGIERQFTIGSTAA
jgi:hypothetical protein